MSSCLILQNKNNYYIASDSAGTIYYNNEFIRYSNSINKIFAFNGYTYFCSGVKQYVDDFNNWFVTYLQTHKTVINDDISLQMIKYNSIKNEQSFPLEVVICLIDQNNNSQVISFDRTNSYQPIVHRVQNGVNIIVAGCKTKEMFTITSECVRQNRTVIDICKIVFNAICDVKIGGKLKICNRYGQLYNGKIESDNFKVADTLLVISEAVLSGYVEGSLIAGGMIQSTAENTAGNPITWINLQDGTFSFANGSLTWGADGLKIAGYDSTDLATKSSLAAGTTTINGGCLTTGIIKSNVNATTGNPVSQINLQDGTFSFANGNLTYDGTTLNLQGILNSSIINGGTINGTSIYGGQIGIGSNGDGYNFYVDTDGNLTLNGNINMAAASNINWGENAPVKYQFSTNGSSGWHDTMSSSDMYRRDSLDGGATWGDAYQFRGEDGRDGSDGSDANVPDYIQSTYIDSTIIKSPTIEANEVNMYGGIFSLYNWDGSSAAKQGYIGLATGMDGDGNETQGVSMSAQTTGSIGWYGGFPFFIVDTNVGSVTVTNAGARLNCGDNEICVTDEGAYVKVNGTRYSLVDTGTARFG